MMQKGQNLVIYISYKFNDSHIDMINADRPKMKGLCRSCGLHYVIVNDGKHK